MLTGARAAIATIGLICALAAGAVRADPAAGARDFAICASCHTRAAGEPAKSGPNLVGVFGHKAATADKAFDYSAALRRSGLTWTPRNLDAWLSSPDALVAGTNMAFAGVASGSTRADLIAYLKQLGEH